jgi:tetratricopeptide (TPR) repeat protein
MLLRFLKSLTDAGKPANESECVRLAGELLARSRHEEAIEMLNRLLDSRPDNTDGLVLRATIRRMMGQAETAASDLERAAVLDPENPRCLYELAAVSYLLGDTRRALGHCERLRQVAPDNNAAYMLQAQIRLGGESYFKVLERILAYVKPRTYVEIGVESGDSIRLVKPPTFAIGIDPEPRLTAPLAENHRLFAETSDAFFAGHDLHAELGGLPVDVAFIDGMHHFEYALRDFANLERYCTRDSTILIHDCYPLDRETAERDRLHVFWSGDIWRLIVLLKKYRPDLTVYTIGTPPTGLGLVCNLDPASRYLLDHYDRLCEEFLALDYSHLDGNQAERLNLFPNDWQRIRALLDAS